MTINIESVKREHEILLLIEMVRKLLLELGDEAYEIESVNTSSVTKSLMEEGKRHAAFLASDENGVVVGCITIQEMFAIYAGGKCGIINELYISPEYRNQGVGRMLIDRAKEYATNSGWKRLEVTAPMGEQWKRTVRFYEREGFIHTGPKLKVPIAGKM
jgi:GNAT superfamily N-acetyltransferase